MMNVALDPSETRTPAAETRPHIARVALFGMLGLAGMGGFAAVANHLLSGFAGPQRPPIAIRQKAADWPDLKDGLPTLAEAPRPSSAVVREVATAPADPRRDTAGPSEPVVRIAERPAPVLTPLPATPVSPAASAAAKPQAAPEGPSKPLPAIVNVPVIEATRQAKVVAPTRTVQAVIPLPAETVRARTAGTAFAALPAEPAKTKPRPDLASKPVATTKPVAVEKTVAAKKPEPVQASVATPAADEETEVFGIKVPSLAPAGRKIRESVEAFGDAVKTFPDRF